MPNAASSKDQRGHDLLICLALLVMTLAVYWPIRGFDFINYDDSEYVSENARVAQGLTMGNTAWAFRTFFFENWHPLTWLSYLLDYQLFGPNPGAFHLVNLLFHALNTVLVFSVFKRMTGARWPSAFAAAMFGVHPLHVESVAWIAERKDVLSGFFWMLTIWAYARYVERPQVWRYLLALLFFALGLMAKPMLVTLPFVLLLLDFWPLGRMRWGGFAAEEGASASLLPKREEGRLERSTGRKSKEGPLNSPRPSPLTPLPSDGRGGAIGRSLLTPAPTVLKLMAEKIPFLLLTAASCVVTYLAQHGARASAAGLPVAQRMANALVSYGRYLGKTIWPDKLAVYYPHPGQWPAWQVAGAAVLVLAITVLTLRLRRKRPYLAVGWLWYLGTLVPVLGLVQVGGQSMADRYMYVPMVGLLVMAAWGAADVAARWGIKKIVLSLTGGCVVFGSLWVSSVQLRCWKDSLALFEHALGVTGGNTVAHDQIGEALLAQGKTNEAVVHLSASLAIDPHDFMAYGNLGNVLFGQGHTDEAMAQYQQGLQFNPKNPELNHNLGRCLAQQGKFSEAIPYYQTALQFRAEYADAYLDLGNALLALGKFDEAITNYATVVRLRPLFGPAHFNLGIALTRQGKHDEAAIHYLETLRLQPNSAEAHCNLALGLAAQGKNREAAAQLMEALRLKPGEAQFHFHLANVLEAERRGQEALAQYREVLRLKPDTVLALNNLAWILATHEDARVRNGAEALKCAERACELAGRQESFLLGTLAAAYAETGRFPEAVSTAQKAIELATAAGQKEIAAVNQKSIELYRAGKPFREAPKP